MKHICSDQLWTTVTACQLYKLSSREFQFTSVMQSSQSSNMYSPRQEKRSFTIICFTIQSYIQYNRTKLSYINCITANIKNTYEIIINTVQNIFNTLTLPEVLIPFFKQKNTRTHARNRKIASFKLTGPKPPIPSASSIRRTWLLQQRNKTWYVGTNVSLQ